MRTALAFVAAGILFVAPAADAQTAAPAPRPVGALFGSGRPGGSQQLDLNVSSFAAYDTNVVEDDPNPILDRRIRQSGTFGGLTTRANYVKTFQHGSFGLVEESVLRRYTGGNILGVQHIAGANFEARLKRTGVSFSQQVGFVPFYSFTTLPPLFESGAVEPAVPDVDQAIIRREQWLYASALSVTQELGNRVSASLVGSYQLADFSHEPTRFDYAAGMGRLSFGMTKGLSLVAGYGVSQATYQLPGEDRLRVLNHTIDAGVNFNRPLSLTRRTTLGFSSGVTALQDQQQVTQYRATIEARLSRDFLRSWHAIAAYHRGMGFVEGFVQPFYTDSVTAGLDGMMGRRVELTASAGYTLGEASYTALATRSESYSGTARLRIALGRQAALAANYFYYHYRFEQTDLLPEGLPPRLERQGLRVGLDIWLPLVR